MKIEPMLGTQVLRKLYARELFVISRDQMEAMLAELDELYCLQMATVRPHPMAPYDPGAVFQPDPPNPLLPTY